MSTPIAIAVADIHLSHIAPAARANEPDWYEAQRRQLRYLKNLQKELNVPTFIAGDLFHKYNPPAELINFALTELPDNIYAVPGQHDLSYHNLQDIHKSAYYTLIQAGKIKTAPFTNPIISGTTIVHLYGFPFGQPLLPHPNQPTTERKTYHIALIHDYCHHGKSTFLNAPEDKTADRHIQTADNYDFLIFGDNHMPFEYKSNNTTVINCGGFYRRTIAEIDHKPSVVILYSDGTYKRNYVPITNDVFIEKQTVPTQSSDINDFVKYLSNTTTNPLDVEEVIREYVQQNNTPQPIQTEIRRLLEQAK